MGHIRPVPVKKEFAAIWQWLRRGGERQHLTSTGGQRFAAVAHIATKGHHPGEKVIVIRDAVTGRRDAGIFECCWGWGQTHSGTWIDQYVEPLDNADP